MTTAQARLAAFGCLALGVLGVYISKRPTSDIVLGTLGALGFLYFLVSSLASGRHRAGRRRRHEQERQTPWTVFSAPARDQKGKWLVGIRRRMEDGTVLGREITNTLDEDDEMAIIEAEGLAELKARRWNDRKVD
jgi:hypothetical protein